MPRALFPLFSACPAHSWVEEHGQTGGALPTHMGRGGWADRVGLASGQGWEQASRLAASGSLLQLKGQGVPSSARLDWHCRSASWQTERQGGRIVPSGVQ